VGVVKALLKAGADPHRADGGGHTPLFWATLHGHVRVVEALLDGSKLAVGGRGILVRNFRHHDTPLHWACSFRRPEVAQLLIERYSNNNTVGTYGLLTCRNKQGVTPLDVLRSGNPTTLDQAPKAVALRTSILRSYAGALSHRYGTRCLHALLREAAASISANDGNKEQKLSFHLAVGILELSHLEFLLECVNESEPGAVRTLDDDTDRALLPLQRACQWNLPEEVIHALLRPYPDALLLL